MPRGASPKRERQHEHVKTSERKRGVGRKRAEEIASRTTGKSRTGGGRTKTASTRSTRSGSPSSRTGGRSHTSATGRTRDQLYEDARRAGVKGRSSMTKGELMKALGVKA